MGNQLGTLQNLIALQNLLTQAIARTNAIAFMTPSMVPPIMEDEENYLGQLLGVSVVTWATSLQACRRKIKSIVRVEALIRKMNGKKPYWVQCGAKGKPIGSRRYTWGSTLKRYSHGWIQASYK
jgi:hypothetical protein